MSDEAARVSPPGVWQRVAPHYEASWSAVTGRFIPTLLESARIERGSCLLDLACGTGLVSKEASRRGCRVVGMDVSSAMIQRAQRVVTAASFALGDAVRLPVARSVFNAVASNFGMPHFWRPEEALAEVFGALKPGGRVAYSVWAPDDENRALESLDLAFERALGEEESTPGRRPPAFARRADYRALLERIGFVDADLVRVDRHWRPASAEAVYEAELLGSGGSRGELLRALGEDRRSRVREALMAAVGRFETVDGIAIPIAAYVISASRPEGGDG